MAHRTGKDGPMGTPIPTQPAYVRLDGYAGVTKLFGTVDRATHGRLRFTPDRDCYQFRRGVAKWVLAKHVRFQYADTTSIQERTP